MIHCIVLTYSSDVYGDSLVNYIFCFCYSLFIWIWIKFKPD